VSERRHGVIFQASTTTAALAARDIQERTQCADEWNALISMVLVVAG
jgi:hypothetical protein